MEDEKIIELFFNRSEDAISALSEKYGAYCRKIAGNILKNPEDAEECLNDAYLRTWDSIPPGKPEKLGAYAGRITRNTALNRLKHDSAEKRGNGEAETALSEIEDCIPDKNGIDEHLDSAVLTEIIEKFLCSQPKEKRSIFIRRYWYFYPVKDIAKTYGMTEARVKSMLFRMRSELRKVLEKEDISL